MAAQRTHRWAILPIALQLLCWTVAQAQQVVPYAAQSGADLNTTSRLEDYIIQNQRQYAANILSYEQQLAELRNNYQDQVSTMNTQSEQIEVQLRLIDDRLNPLELLDELSKHCVQRYRAGLATIASVKTAIANCMSTSTSYLATLTSGLEATMRNLNNYYIISLKNVLTECTKKNPTSQLNYTICVTQAISAANVYTASNKDTFSTQLQQAKCSGDGRIQTSLRCSFTVIFNTISTAGKITSSIDDCIAGIGACAPCPAPTGRTCDRVAYMDPNEVDFQNTTMPNPLYGYRGNVTCLHLDFVNIPS